MKYQFMDCNERESIAVENGEIAKPYTLTYACECGGAMIWTGETLPVTDNEIKPHFPHKCADCNDEQNCYVDTPRVVYVTDKERSDYERCG